MSNEQFYRAKGNYQDMAWRLIQGQEGTWIILRENVLLEGPVAHEEIRLQARLTAEEQDEMGAGQQPCQGNIQVYLHWRAGAMAETLFSAEEGEEGPVRRCFLSQPLDGGKGALGRQAKPFGASRFPGCVWQGEPPLRCKEGWQLHTLNLPWQAGGGCNLVASQARLVCLHGVRTGLRTVLLEALVQVPFQEEEPEQWPGRFWLEQEDWVLDLEDDAVMEVLGISFQDGMMQRGYNRDARCWQLQWLCQATIFYLRAPSGGGRLGAATLCQLKSALLPALADPSQGATLFQPARRDVLIRIVKPERLLCRFGLFLKAGGQAQG